MHPIEKELLKAMADHDVSQYPADVANSDNYSVSMVIDGSIISRIAATRLVDTLRKTKLIEGHNAPVKISDLNNLRDSLPLGDNASLKTDDPSGQRVVLSISFAPGKPAEIHRKLGRIADHLERMEQQPSALEPVLDAVKSTFRAAGMPVKQAVANGNDIEVTLSTATSEKHQRAMLEALCETGLVKLDDVQTAPTVITDGGKKYSWHLTFPGMSVREVQAGLFKAEIILRERDMSEKWFDRVNNSTFVNRDTGRH